MRKIAHEFPGQGLEFAQPMIDYDAADSIDVHGQRIRRIAQKTTRGAGWTKPGHDAGKALGPVAGAKDFAILGDAVNNKLLHKTMPS